MKKVMDVCAEGTECVENLKFYIRRLHPEISKNLMEKNRASLSRIIMEQPYYEELEDENQLNDLLDSFLLPVLEELVLNCLMPEGVRRNFRNRAVYWQPVVRVVEN